MIVYDPRHGDFAVYKHPEDAVMAAKAIGHAFMSGCPVQERFTGLTNVYFGARFKSGSQVFETVQRLCAPPVERVGSMRLLDESTGKVEDAEVIESADKGKVLVFLGR